MGLVPTAKLVIVGDGPAKKALMDQVDQLVLNDRVILTGEISNDKVTDYYHIANLFVSTSVSESQGLTYIEALASGLHVLATHSPYTDKLLDDSSLGATFQNLDEMVADVYAYLTRPSLKMDPNIQQKKLTAISANEFGERIVKFYSDSSEYYLKHIASGEPSEI